MRFLIVDDAEKPLQDLTRLLGEMGHQVVGVARNGQEAVEQFRRLEPDVVVMDVIMPRMNGLEALQVIRESDPDVSVIMACSLRSCRTAFESERIGATYYLNKPFQEPRLRKVVARIDEERKSCRAGSPQPLRKQARTASS